MKEPKFGSNVIQSFVDFDYASGTFRLGAEGKQLFVEIESTKWFITDTSGAVVTDTISERTAATGITIDGVKLKDKMITIDNALGRKSVV